MSPLSPAYDNKIVRKYSARTIEHKMENKTSLQEEIGWIAEPKQPIVCISTGMTDALGGPLLEQLLDGLLELPIGLLIRGRGSSKYGEMFTKMAKSAPYKMKIMTDNEISLRKMLAASVIALFLSSQQDPDAVEDALRYGVIPVAPAIQKLDNYNPVQETGNAFIYDKETKWQCFAALVRALETFKFPYDWRTIQRHAMESAQTEEPTGD